MEHYIVGSARVSTANGLFSCTCILFRRAGKCGHVAVVEKRLADAKVPRFVEPPPVEARKPVVIEKSSKPPRFGERKIRQE